MALRDGDCSSTNSGLIVTIILGQLEFSLRSGGVADGSQRDGRWPAVSMAVDQFPQG